MAKPRRRQQQLTQEPPVLHLGLPCPRVMYERVERELRGATRWPPDVHGAHLRMLEQAKSAYFRAYLDYVPMCPVRYERRPSSWRCRHCGVQDQYERVVMAWVTLRSSGNPDDEQEVWQSLVESEQGTIRCLGCGYDDDMEEIRRPPAALPDWSIGLDGKEREIA